MKISEAMTSNVEYLTPDTTIYEAAQKMRDLDCGFLPVGDEKNEKLQGVITDRDITIRAVAENLSPRDTRVTKILSAKVLYCYQDDDIDSAAQSMHDQQVYRLIVLNNKEDKKMVGVISLNDIVRHDQESIAGRVAKGISRSAA